MRFAARQDASRPWTILINNTGGPPAGRAVDATGEQLVAAFNAQLIVAQLLTQLPDPPGMKSAQFGRVINITSTSVKQPHTALGDFQHRASRRGQLAAEVGVAGTWTLGITVNNVLPGYTATERLASLASGARQDPRRQRSRDREGVDRVDPGRATWKAGGSRCGDRIPGDSGRSLYQRHQPSG